MRAYNTKSTKQRVVLSCLAKSAWMTGSRSIPTLALAFIAIGLFQPYSSGVKAACVCRIEPTYNPNCRSGTFINVNDHGNDWCWISRYLVRQACEDNELKGECLKAEGEISDWASGVYSLRDSLLDRIIYRNESVTLKQLAVTKRAVTRALENLRTNLGLHLECTKGLQTQTLIDGTHSHCYSPELFKVCEHAKNKSIELYYGVVRELKKQAEEDDNILEDFVEAFTAGMEAGDNTIDIHCNVTAHNLWEIDSASSNRSIMAGLYFIPVIAGLILFGL
mmetsp:Transcript_2242/g.3152  ORF Transcript_2242/g.3152 Transcript_2242/m.3152 type:complete len:278 (-) Transcript_2242:317-1150(-)|eukprot:CAMPEP_0185725458 /NCGR_PEP_ID=MMETSP1171-20130828/1717_1 /TAXON_ID=374046 /ORGANISM="Helicotheca tamensis, Strain CCMP826" /LENGTH=277 /DNA_ID=CAMNT_0028393597 /DNA_START=96 /DNA_END=929 /DNA_ORIENTATION=-